MLGLEIKCSGNTQQEDKASSLQVSSILKHYKKMTGYQTKAPEEPQTLQTGQPHFKS